jgi:hypothetical protein
MLKVMKTVELRLASFGASTEDFTTEFSLKITRPKLEYK